MANLPLVTINDGLRLGVGNYGLAVGLTYRL